MPESSAEALFVDFLRRGVGAELEAFCAEHPKEAARLRELHAAHEAALARLRAAGIHAIPPSSATSSFALRSASPASGDLLRRIVAQGSKGARYQLRGEIARGGMGAILRVWDEDLGRELAMKVVLGSDGEVESSVDATDSGRRISRFLEEAQITGQLDHPCVVPVHELGLDGTGRVYFTMRLVKGRDLGRIIELARAGQEGWTQTRALGVLLRVCEAMAYAHSKGVVHRDLKPSNVMVGGFGEVYVMDWGLARVLGRADAHDQRLRDASATTLLRTPRRAERTGSSESPLVTMEGDVVGTPAYMPPEQARGRIDEISARSDVYAIGAMLYHLLAGHMPFVGNGESKSNVEVLRAVLDGAPKPLRDVSGDVPAELEAICEKAMAREMTQRYADTLELADDLRSFLEGRVVKAYETGAIVELRKWVARNRALATAAAAALVFLVAGAIGSLWQKSVADRNAAAAVANAAEATRKGELARASQALAEAKAAEAASAAQRAGVVRDFLTTMLASTNPLNSFERDVPISRAVDAAAKRLDAGELANDAESEFALRNTLGGAYQSINRYEESERQYRIAIEVLAKIATPEPWVPIALDVDLGDVLAARGNHAEAEGRARSALAALEGLASGFDHLRANALSLLATCRYNAGATREAIDAARRAIEVRAAIEGEDGERTALQRTRLAFYLLRDGASDEAFAETERAVGVLQNGSQRARIEAASALRARADAHFESRRFDAAESDLRAALALRLAVFGEESPQVADVLTDLGQVRGRLGDLDEAESLGRRALAARRSLLGSHRDTATTLTTLAATLQLRGRIDEARALLDESLAMRLELFGAASSPVADSQRRLGDLAVEAGDLAAAEALYRASCASWERSVGAGSRDLADTMHSLGKLLGRLGRAAEARAVLEKSLASRVALLGPLHAHTNEARDSLTTVLLQAQDWTAAEGFLRSTLAEYESAKKPNTILIAYTGGQLGAALAGQGKLDEAERLLLAGWAAIGDNPKMWAVNKLFLLDHLVALYVARGDETSATAYREKAAALRR